jgi:hypothetical protein
MSILLCQKTIKSGQGKKNIRGQRRKESEKQNFLKCIAEIDKEMQPESDREQREQRQAETETETLLWWVS